MMQHFKHEPVCPDAASQKATLPEGTASEAKAGWWLLNALSEPHHVMFVVVPACNVVEFKLRKGQLRHT